MPITIEKLKEYQKNHGEIYRQIGLLASDWSFFELQVNECIWTVAGFYPAFGACVTSQLTTMNSRLVALISLMRLRKFSDELITSMNQFSDRIRVPLEKRN